MTTPMPTIEELIAKAKDGDPYALGAKPSAPDVRDFVLTPQAADVPATYTHPAVRKVPVRLQQGGSCVGTSIATCLSYLEYAETGKIIPFNGELMNGRVVAKQYGPGAGATAHDVLDDILNHGAVAFMGDNGISLYFPKAYAAVDHTNVNAVKAAMSTPGTMVTIATWLLSNFGAGDGKEYAPNIPSETPWGFHEVTLVGYDDKGVLVQNQWDNTWGDSGFCRFAWDYVTARVAEMWAITDNADNANGTVAEWMPPTELNNGRAVRKGKTRAVYLIETGGRIWVQSPAQAKQMGINLYSVQSLDPTDKVWNLPVIGPDAPIEHQTS